MYPSFLYALYAFSAVIGPLLHLQALTAEHSTGLVVAGSFPVSTLFSSFSFASFSSVLDSIPIPTFSSYNILYSDTDFDDKDVSDVYEGTSPPIGALCTDYWVVTACRDVWFNSVDVVDAAEPSWSGPTDLIVYSPNDLALSVVGGDDDSVEEPDVVSESLGSVDVLVNVVGYVWGLLAGVEEFFALLVLAVVCLVVVRSPTSSIACTSLMSS